MLNFGGLKGKDMSGLARVMTARFSGNDINERLGKMRDYLDGKSREEQLEIVMAYLEDKDRDEKLEIVVEFLNICGLKPVYSKNERGLRSLYYLGEASVFSVVHKPSAHDEYEYILIDKDVYDRYLADGQGTLSLVQRDGKSYYKAILNYQKSNIALHRRILEDAGYDLAGMQVDHVVHDTMINTKDFLRPCTGRQNALNRSNSRNKMEITDENYFEANYMDSFRYNPVLDFRDTWYAIVFYKMLNLPSKVVCDYNRDYILRHSEMPA